MDDRDVVLGRCELKALQADATVSVSLPTLPFTLGFLAACEFMLSYFHST